MFKFIQGEEIMLKLLEIIWEIIPTCNKGCKFCGSKDITSLGKDQWLSVSQMNNLIDNLSGYFDGELNLSGGEPGLLLKEKEYLPIMEKLLKIYKNKIKVITNGLFITNLDVIPVELRRNISVIGLSFNGLEDNIDHLLDKTKKENITTTLITNIGTHNIFVIEDMYEYIKSRDDKSLKWQIQLTMGEYLLQPNGIEYLRNWIKKAQKENEVNIYEADNLQEEHSCSAGINSCGILYNGDVVNCLSERSYNKDNIEVQGNLLYSFMQVIWESKFKVKRFGCSVCCRDCIEYKKDIEDVKLTKNQERLKKIMKGVTDTPHEIEEGEKPIIMMYGVIDDGYKPIKKNYPYPKGGDITFVYGVR